jgi:hypothetical protein
MVEQRAQHVSLKQLLLLTATCAVLLAVVQEPPSAFLVALVYVSVFLVSLGLYDAVAGPESPTHVESLSNRNDVAPKRMLLRPIARRALMIAGVGSLFSVIAMMLLAMIGFFVFLLE